MQVVSRQMGGLGGGKPGGLQDMIKNATAENRPGPDWALNRSIVEYINRSPNRGSDKAFRYMKARFTQNHVKVQNLTLLVLETCMKNCGHMFREKLPFSELWEELHKVAILKRKADVQIYNKVLALIEDWSDAISLPAYRQEFTSLKAGAARFPVRPERDLSGYVPDGQHGGIPTQLVIPPGTSDEDRAAIEQAQAELNGPRPGVMQQHSSNGKPAPFTDASGQPPYTYAGDGHFTPTSQDGVGRKPNAAQLPPNHLMPGQAPAKLKEDLFSTANSIELFNEMLALIRPSDAADVKQEFVKEQAEQCREMMKRLGALAESESDEGTLQQTLELHSALEGALEQYDALLAVAEGRAPPEAALHEEGASVSAAPTAGGPSRVTPKPSLNLLDFADDSPLQDALASAGNGSAAGLSGQPSGSGAAGSPAAPAAKPRTLAEDILGDLLAPTPAEAAGGPGAAPGGLNPDWGSAAVRQSQPATNNPFASSDVPDVPASDGFGDSAFGAAPANEASFGAAGGAGSPTPGGGDARFAAAPSPVNLSPQSNYPAPPQGGSGMGFSSPASQQQQQHPPQFGGPQQRPPPLQQPGGWQQPYPQMQQFGQAQFGQPPAFGQPQYGGHHPQFESSFGQPPPSGALQQYPQGFYAAPLSLPPAPNYAQQPGGLQQDGFGGSAFGAPQQFGAPPRDGFSHGNNAMGNPWGAAGPSQAGPGPAGGQAWGAPSPGSGQPSPAAAGGQFGAKPVAAWPPPKDADPFGDLVSLRK